MEAAGEMNMLEAFDSTGRCLTPASWFGVSHHTLARYVAAREPGALSERLAVRARLIDTLTTFARLTTADCERFRQVTATLTLTSVGCGGPVTGKLRRRTPQEESRRAPIGSSGGTPRREPRPERSGTQMKNRQPPATSSCPSATP